MKSFANSGSYLPAIDGRSVGMRALRTRSRHQSQIFPLNFLKGNL